MPPEIEPLAFDPNEQIQALLLRLNCARLDARFDAESGEVSLSGRLSSQADQRALVEQISAIAGIRRVEASTLKVLGKPYCEILDLLNRPELAKSDELRHDVGKLGDASVPDIQRLPVGAPLNLSFHAPDFASYVYVVYLSSDGTVSHLLPAGFPGERLEPREQFTIGDQGEGGSPITITPPVGLDIVLALGSSEPLFLEPRKQGEPISDYLRALGSAIDRVRAERPFGQVRILVSPDRGRGRAGSIMLGQ